MKEIETMKKEESPAAALDRLKGALQQTLRPARLSDQRYDETHEHFERSSSQQQLILDWLKDLTHSYYAKLDPLRILSVGCGSGIFDLSLIESLATISNRVEYTGVDPNAVACRRFREDFDDLELANVRLDLREQNIEALNSTDRFDLIHAVHSLYYFDDPAATLDYLLSLLAPGGRMVIVQAPHEELNQLSKCFWKHHADNAIWFSDQLEEYFSQRGLAFTKQRIDGEVDVSRCFEADCSRGEMLLDFITQTDSRQFEDEVRQLCVGYLRSVSRQEKEGLLVPHPVEAFVVTADADRPIC